MKAMKSPRPNQLEETRERVAGAVDRGGSDGKALTQFMDLRKTKKVRRTFADPPLPLPR